jgi:hypothetical protein
MKPAAAMCGLVQACLLALFVGQASAQMPASPTSLSGIYPHLAMFNDEGECGTGAVVPWADRLWAITYAPHKPTGSTDKLYEIDFQLEQTIRPESIGGTPANRMIHRESQQLFIGPYAIDASRNVRVIPYAKMYGRPTGNARHLFDPAGKIYYATMEEGLYEVDVKSLEVTELWADEQLRARRQANLPGYHGKGLFSGQGRIVYANNGDHAPAALRDPTVPSGVLAQWDGRADQWTVVQRNQFTEVTGPGGIYGNEQPETDPLWTIGWDHRSLILMCLDGGLWQRYRLPKSSHSYDGAHGWNTEWPRIRDIGEDALLMTMHGAFWKFPKTFSATNSIGITPRSNYLKVIGDFARWKSAAGDRIVFGCDDTAKNEFLNKRKVKGEITAPQSQSNLWFVEPVQLDNLGPALGRGGPWVADDVPAGTPSDPFLVIGFDRRGLYLTHEGDAAANVVVEVDAAGTGRWTMLRDIAVPPQSITWIDLSDWGPATWARLSCSSNLVKATAWFSFANEDSRAAQADAMFQGLAEATTADLSGGVMRARDKNTRTLALAAVDAAGNDVGIYELSGELALKRVDDEALHRHTKESCAIPAGFLTADAASIVLTDDSGRRWRFPRGDASLDQPAGFGPARIAREVATERDLLSAGGTFYELPAENAGGFAKVRAVATHNRRIHDFCSYSGLFLMSGVAADAPANPHILRSDDGRAALWAGAIDDVWKLGKPRGLGGPWRDSK